MNERRVIDALAPACYRWSDSISTSLGCTCVDRSIQLIDGEYVMDHGTLGVSPPSDGKVEATLSEVELRLRQIEELIPFLRVRAQSLVVDDLDGLVIYFRTLLKTVQPRPTYEDLLARAQFAICLAALDCSEGNKTSAAQDILGLSRFGFQKIMERCMRIATEAPKATAQMVERGKYRGRRRASPK